MFLTDSPARDEATKNQVDAPAAVRSGESRQQADPNGDVVRNPLPIAAPQSQDVAVKSVPSVFGESGPVTIESIPRGRFYNQLLSLNPAAREKAMKSLGDLRVPLLDVYSLHVDANGALFYACNPKLGDGSEAEDESLTSSLPVGDDAESPVSKQGEAQAAVPISAPPARSSLPGAESVIYLDFNGHNVSGTAWNSSTGKTNLQCVPFDLDGDPTTFNDAEQAAIVEVWERVAEDYKVFNINVTTVEPPSYTSKVARALITKNKDLTGANNPSPSAGGVAYLDVFGDSNFSSYYSPAFAYYNNVGSSARNISEVISHEIGHNLGLSHDGTKSAEYYSGHGSGENSWGPIMGASYYRNFTQFSKGEYYNANNSQDDLAIIAAKAGYSSDDIGNTTSNSSSVNISADAFLKEGFIGANSDLDLLRVVTDKPVLTINAESFKIAGSMTYGSNLGIKLELLSATGNVLSSSTTQGQSTGALTSNVSPGTYYIRISGAGTGTPLASTPTGFTGYGSMGGYKIWGTIGSGGTSFAPILGNGSSSSTTRNSTTISSTVNPNGLATTFYFQYGPTPSYGAVSANQSAGSGSSPVSLSASLVGLASGTTYYYRPVASNSAGVAYGGQQSFTTLSTDVNLQSLALSNGTLSPVFSSQTRNYTATVANEVTSITATWLTEHAGASSQCRINNGNFTIVARGQSSSPLPLQVGNNTINIRVTAQDGLTSANNTITVRRLGSSNADLSALTATAGSFTPAFQASTTTYNLTVANAISSTTINATKAVPGGQVQIRLNEGGFKALAVGKASGSLALIPGLNRIELRVSAEDAVTTKSYVLNITRTPSVTDVAGLGLRWGATSLAFAPTFSSSTFNYTLTVPSSASEISFLPTLVSTSSTAAWRLNGGNYVTIKTGKSSAAINLIPGINSAQLRVLSDNNVDSRTYSFKIDRLYAPVANAAQSITLNSTSLSGSVDSRATAAAFQYGPSSSFGFSMPVSLAGGSGMIPVSTSLSGLQPSTLYYYRLTSQYGGVMDASAPGTFVTQPRLVLEPLTLSGGNATIPGVSSSTFASFGNPAINNSGDVAFQATMAFTGANASNRSALWVTKNGSLVLVARAGASAPGGGIFVKFGDPQINSDGLVSFSATLEKGVQGVTDSTATGIWKANAQGTLTLVARSGSVAPGTNGALFSAFGALVLPDHKGPIFTATLTRNGTEVTAANNSGLWATNNAGAVVLVARLGAAPTPTLSSFAIFNSESGREGQSRHFESGGDLLLTAKFGTNPVGLYKILYPSMTVTPSSPLVAAGHTAPGAGGAVFSTIGNAILNGNGAVAFAGTLSGNGITTSNNTGIWLYGANGTGSQLLRTGQEAPGGGVFKSLSAPLLNSVNEIAFTGTLTGNGVTKTTATGIWSADSSGTLQMVARSGAAAPGLSGAVFGTFNQLACPDETGVVFVATLVNGYGGTSNSNNVGLWAVPAPGETPELILRKGDSFTAGGVTRTVAEILIFNSTAENAGATRHINSSGDLIFKINFTNGSSGLFGF